MAPGVGWIGRGGGIAVFDVRSNACLESGLPIEAFSQSKHTSLGLSFRVPQGQRKAMTALDSAIADFAGIRSWSRTRSLQLRRLADLLSC